MDMVSVDPTTATDTLWLSPSSNASSQLSLSDDRASNGASVVEMARRDEGDDTDSTPRNTARARLVRAQARAASMSSGNAGTSTGTAATGAVAGPGPSSRLKRLSLLSGSGHLGRSSLDSPPLTSSSSSSFGSSSTARPNTPSTLGSPDRPARRAHVRGRSSISYSPSSSSSSISRVPPQTRGGADKRASMYAYALDGGTPQPHAHSHSQSRSSWNYVPTGGMQKEGVGLGVGDVNVLDIDTQARRRSMLDRAFAGGDGDSGKKEGGGEGRKGETLAEQHADLLTAIAKKERRVNELKRDLAEQESALVQLKNDWTALITRSRPPHVPAHAHPSRRPIQPAPVHVQDKTAPETSPPTLTASPTQASRSRHPLSASRLGLNGGTSGGGGGQKHHRSASSVPSSSSTSSRPLSSTSAAPSSGTQPTLFALPEATEPGSSSPSASPSASPSPPPSQTLAVSREVPIRIASALDDLTESSLSSLSHLLSSAAEYSASADLPSASAAALAAIAHAQAHAPPGAAAALEGGKRFWGTLVKTVSAAAAGNAPLHSADDPRFAAGEEGPLDGRGDRASRVGPLPPANARRLSVQMHRRPLPLSRQQSGSDAEAGGAQQGPEGQTGREDEYLNRTDRHGLPGQLSRASSREGVISESESESDGWGW